MNPGTSLQILSHCLLSNIAESTIFGLGYDYSSICVMIALLFVKAACCVHVFPVVVFRVARRPLCDCRVIGLTQCVKFTMCVGFQTQTCTNAHSHICVYIPIYMYLCVPQYYCMLSPFISP